MRGDSDGSFASAASSATAAAALRGPLPVAAAVAVVCCLWIAAGVGAAMAFTQGARRAQRAVRPVRADA